MTFENVPIQGDGALRLGEDAALAEMTGLGVARATDPFAAEGAYGAREVPTARLAIGAGQTHRTGANHRAVHRERPLLNLVDHPNRPGWRLVHGHVGYPEGAAAAAAARRLGVPFVLTEHATFLATYFADRDIRPRYVAATEAAARMITVSRMLADEILVEIPALEPKLVVIPNAVAVDDFRPVPASQRLPDELLWVGYRIEQKGIITLLEAFRAVRAARPELTLRLVGKSPSDAEEQRWHSAAEQLGVAGSVRFDPPTDRAGVIEAMSRATLFVHPSTRETFGVVAIEALSAGLPVVAADSGGVTEVLGPKPGRFGALVPARDPDALAAAVLATLDRRDGFDPDELRSYAMTNFSGRAVAARVVDVYEEVLGESDAGAPTTSSSAVAARSARPAPGVDDDSPVVVAFARSNLNRVLVAMPDWAIEGLTVVTAGGPSDRPIDLRLAPDGTERRLAQLLGWTGPFSRPKLPVSRLRWLVMLPLRTARLLRNRRRLEREVLATLRETLAVVLAERDSPPLLVCVHGVDELVARPFVLDGRARPAAGGLRWLADVRWSRDPTVRQAKASEPAGSQ